MADEIRKQLAVAEATRILLDAHDSYEDARAGGATLAEAAAKLNLKVVTVDAIDRQALRPDGTIVNDLPESPELLKQAFETEVGIENPAINIGSTGYVFYEVQGVTPGPRPHAGRGARQGRRRLEVGRGGEAARRQGGRTCQAGQGRRRARRHRRRAQAREADQARREARGRRRRFRQGGRGGDVRAWPKAAPAWCRTPAGDGRIIFKVAEVFEPAGAGPDSVPEDARKSFASGLSDDLLDQLVARLQSEYDVTVDQSAIQQALAF